MTDVKYPNGTIGDSKSNTVANNSSEYSTARNLYDTDENRCPSKVFFTYNVDAVEVVRCKDCEYYNGEYKYCVNDIFAKPNGYCSYGKRKEDAGFSDGVDLNIIFKQPKPKPNLFAKWICLGHRIGFLKHPYSVDWKCSNCGYESYWITPPVCPNCGAKMDEVEENA